MSCPAAERAHLLYQIKNTAAAQLASDTSTRGLAAADAVQEALAFDEALTRNEAVTSVAASKRSPGRLDRVELGLSPISDAVTIDRRRLDKDRPGPVQPGLLTGPQAAEPVEFPLLVTEDDTKARRYRAGDLTQQTRVDKSLLDLVGHDLAAGHRRLDAFVAKPIRPADPGDGTTTTKGK